MQWKDLRILIILVLLSYMITMALTSPFDQPLPPPGPTRTPWPTFASVEPSPIARILAPTSTPRPTMAARVVATASPFRSPVPSTPTPTPPPTPTVIPSPTVPAVVTHVVRAGENVTSIAERYGVTIQAIVEANGLTDPDRLLRGQVLIIPLPDGPSSGPAEIPSPAAPATVSHVVRAGENLTSIAQQSGTTIQAVVQANGLKDPDRLFPGQVLIIPLPGEP